MALTESVRNRSGTCYHLHTPNQWRVCWDVYMQLHSSNGEDCIIIVIIALSFAKQT